MIMTIFAGLAMLLAAGVLSSVFSKFLSPLERSITRGDGQKTSTIIAAIIAIVGCLIFLLTEWGRGQGFSILFMGIAISIWSTQNNRKQQREKAHVAHNRATTEIQETRELFEKRAYSSFWDSIENVVSNTDNFRNNVGCDKDIMSREVQEIDDIVTEVTQLCEKAKNDIDFATIYTQREMQRAAASTEAAAKRAADNAEKALAETKKARSEAKIRWWFR